jgi:hypothetical protein
LLPAPILRAKTEFCDRVFQHLAEHLDALSFSCAQRNPRGDQTSRQQGITAESLGTAHVPQRAVDSCHESRTIQALVRERRFVLHDRIVGTKEPLQQLTMTPIADAQDKRAASELDDDTVRPEHVPTSRLQHCFRITEEHTQSELWPERGTFQMRRESEGMNPLDFLSRNR